MEHITLSSPLSLLKGVGEKRAESLKKAGLFTVKDLLFSFPKEYRNGTVFPLSAERCGHYGTFFLTFTSNPGIFTMAGGRRALRIAAEDEFGGKVNLLYVNQPYLRNSLRKGDSGFFGGILQEKGGKYFLFSPERFLEKPDENRLYPIYRTAGISSKQMEKLVAQCLVPALSLIEETLPNSVFSFLDLMPKNRAVFTLHTPPSEEALNKAKERFAFEGLFDFSVKAALFSKRKKIGTVPAFKRTDLSPFLSLLPYSLTEAQKKVYRRIEEDLVGEKEVYPMNRLIQGDVGSGKTVVAAMAAYLTAKNGKSTLLMAPTEILASQHYSTFRKLFDPLNIPVFLLCGSTPKKERERIFAETEKDTPYILVGTHALTEESARCNGVALSITDEQHRFGVRHRNLLGKKGGSVHSLVMSATPIPRSLAMFLYDEGNISVIDSLPPGRQKVETLYVGEDKYKRVLAFLKEQVSQGRQAYVVCPLIEDEEDLSDLQSAKEEYLAVQKALPDVPCALLHGKMRPSEKTAVMEDFKTGKTAILISTTVIEVGVDVPNATVMVIRSAERFGLSQLHQLRGRVGRGKEKSYCILISSHSGKAARERLRKLCDCHDGFELAKFDLKHRGPGEFFGTRQSGFGAIDLTSALTLPLFSLAKEAAEKFLSSAKEDELLPYGDMTRLN